MIWVIPNECHRTTSSLFDILNSRAIYRKTRVFPALVGKLPGSPQLIVGVACNPDWPGSEEATAIVKRFFTHHYHLARYRMKLVARRRLAREGADARGVDDLVDTVLRRI